MADARERTTPANPWRLPSGSSVFQSQPSLKAQTTMIDFWFQKEIKRKKRENEKKKNKEKEKKRKKRSEEKKSSLFFLVFSSFH